MPLSLTCPKCEGAVLAGDDFCGNCGHAVSGGRQEESLGSAPDGGLLDALRRATLGEYEIREELGRGGMAIVYLAHEIALGRKVAMKVLAPALQLTPGMPKRFLREARTAAGLEHQHIIPIYAVRETPGLVYFTMRWVPGQALSTIVRRVGKLPIRLVRALLADVGGALSFAHLNGVLHRDVKPGNVLVGRDGSIVVMDFGIAKHTDGPGLTLTGQLLGTPGYMSPEQCRGHEVSAASDQYSLGAMAFEMLAGQLPFSGNNAMDVMTRQISDPVPDLLSFRPDCPRDLAKAVVRMLAKDPSNRFPSLDAALVAAEAAPLLPGDPLRTEVVKWADGPARPSGHSVTPVSPTPARPDRIVAAEVRLPVEQASNLDSIRPPERPIRGSRRLVALVFGGIVLIVAAVAAWQAFSVKDPEPGVVAASSGTQPIDSVSALSGPAASPPSPPPAPPAPTPTSGSLVVTRLPARGTVWVDGVRVKQPIELSPGRHELRLEVPGYTGMVAQVIAVAGRTDTVAFTGTVVPVPRAKELEPEPVSEMVPKADGFLLLRVTPFARIFIDGKFAAEEEVIRRSMPSGQHRLRFEKDGFEPKDTSVVIQPAPDTLRVRVRLQQRKP